MTSRSPQEEAEQLQYSLRSSFFYRRRLELSSLIAMVKRVKSGEQDWGEPLALGISESAWTYAGGKRIPPCELFCHPDVVAAQPELIAYYRCLAVLPQKGLQRLAFGVGALERGRGSMGPDRALLLSKVLNGYISALVDSDPAFSVRGALFAAMMNFGAQTNGSWRNEIGLEGSRRVNEVVLGHFLSAGLIASISRRDGKQMPVSRAGGALESIQALELTNGYTVLFGTEPDISILDASGMLEAAVEVKAGIDPAGALERYGAAKKSFDRALQQNKSATTVCLASCITDGVRRAMSDDRLVRRDFNLTLILVDAGARAEFLECIHWLAHLPSPRP